MANSFFQFKEFRIEQDGCAMKVTTDACVLGAWVPVPATGNILDIGTGTGLLALMIAQRSQAKIDAIELDGQSFLQAKKNIEASKWRNRITAIHNNIAVFSPATKYDFIISNPPFFENHLKSLSPQKTISRHDSAMSMSGLLNAVTRLLKIPDGKFAVLLPFNQSGNFIAEAESRNFFLHQKLLFSSRVKSTANRCVMLFACEPTSEVKIETLAVNDEDGNYSAGFSNLLKHFYLHL